MLRTAWVALMGAFCGGLLLAAPAFAQDNGAGPAVQIAPLTVEIAAPVDGKLITGTVPYSAAVTVNVRLVPAASAAFTAPLTVDDAKLLLPALSELPIGFAQTVAPQVASTNDQVAMAYEDPTAVFKLLTDVDRQGGIYSGYQNVQYSPLFGGNSAIGVTALVFGSPEGARTYLDGAMQREVQLKDKPEAVYAVSAPKLGDASMVFKSDRTVNNNKYSDYSLLVQRGNSLLILESRGARNGGNVTQLVDTARTLLARGLDRPAEPAPLRLEGAPPPATQPFVPAPAQPLTPTAQVTATTPTVSEPVTPSEALTTSAVATASAVVTAAESASATGSATATPLAPGAVIMTLPHITGKQDQPEEIGGFAVTIDAVELFDFAQAKAADVENSAFYTDTAFDGATALGVMTVTLKNGADQNLFLLEPDAVIAVGPEQLKPIDYQYTGSDYLGDPLLPGVSKQYRVYFALKQTPFDQLKGGADFRLQAPGPYTADAQPLVKDAKYDIALKLAPAK